jgi:nucleotide-binding universal stress UspA family protein
MNSILLPTDLSETALKGAVYATRLFGTQNSSFTLLYTYADNGEVEPGDRAQPEPNALATEGAHEFEARLRAELDTPDVEVKTIVIPGSIAPMVAELTEGDDYTAVVVGTEYSTGSPGTIFGSHASDVAKAAHAPVLVVPKNAEYKPIERILLTDDGRDVRPSAIDLLLELARSTHAEVVVLRVLPEHAPDDEPNGDPVRHAVLGDVPHTFTTVHAANVVQAIDDEALRNEAAIVAVLHRHLGAMERLFHRSLAKQLAMHSQTPLLVLQQ